MFAINFELKLFPAANVNIESLKSLPTLFDTLFGPHAGAI